MPAGRSRMMRAISASQRLAERQDVLALRHRDADADGGLAVEAE